MKTPGKQFELRSTFERQTRSQRREEREGGKLRGVWQQPAGVAAGARIRSAARHNSRIRAGWGSKVPGNINCPRPKSVPRLSRRRRRHRRSCWIVGAKLDRLRLLFFLQTIWQITAAANCRLNPHYQLEKCKKTMQKTQSCERWMGGGYAYA